MYRSMSSNNIKGLVLAFSSSVFIGASFIIKKKGLKKVVASSVTAGIAMRPLTEAVDVAGRNSRFVLNGVSRMRERPISDLVDGLKCLGAEFNSLRCGLIGMDSSKGNLGWSAWRVKEMVKVGVVQEMTIIHPAIISFSTILSSKSSYNVSILSMMGNTLKILFVVPFQVEIHCRKHVQCNLARLSNSSSLYSSPTTSSVHSNLSDFHKGQNNKTASEFANSAFFSLILQESQNYSQIGRCIFDASACSQNLALH
ncbi:3-phosphoshikimate 1-carboxyvinyltransferase, chloroplastic [Capsicum baccatum]|uniref:3-phosphoshikimate 1-carboxyvinyltransferase, chloroplastic n=1 Tax=Capsicum baccatum TaxID=33114 RepID=A0A2G2W7S0_CAPBA|nr:3-phosphoshikimate 1-carboxyvinyltransferase, chloroplastic [Capsicum baccatum]